MTTNGTALATTAGAAPTATSAQHAFEPSNASEAFHLAKVLVASKLLPRAVGTVEAAFTIIVTGRELGLSAMQSLRSIHVIEGKPTLSADLMMALTKRSPECQWFRLVESSPERAVYETQRKGEPGPTKMTFTFEEAKAAGLAGKDNWRKYPAAMLRARCIAALVRAVYPDVMLGVYEEDELTPAPAAVVVQMAPPAAPPPPESDARAIDAAASPDGELPPDDLDDVAVLRWHAEADRASGQKAAAYIAALRSDGRVDDLADYLLLRINESRSEKERQFFGRIMREHAPFIRATAPARMVEISKAYEAKKKAQTPAAKESA